MKLLIVIPALNEEQSIESIILRTQEASKSIIKYTPVTLVKIIVVSDGSTDNTIPFASKHLKKDELIIFGKNKGYGAAIKAGWSTAPDADLLAFLDADGTCNPMFFIDLCLLITGEDADIAIGSRLSKQSQMPLIRRFGNNIFSIMLSLVSNQRIKDTASGMRVLKRTALHKIMPLPDGLHFTPAMSARAILSQQVKILEKDMPYSEREGNSKLKIWKDGRRFLSVILSNIILYMPYKVFNLFGFFCLLVGWLAIAVPLMFYYKQHFLEDWMLYRFIISILFLITGFLFFSFASLSQHVISFTLKPNIEDKRNIWHFLYFGKSAILFAFIFYVIGFLLIFNSFWDRLTTGLTNEHWSRYLSMIFFNLLGTIVLCTFLANNVLTLVKDRFLYIQNHIKNESF